jgi:uncharacterized membrane protein
MRTTRDRIRHAISFEVIGLILVTPLGAWGFGMPLHAIAVVTLVSATIATLWNYVYNIWFDRAMLRLRGDVRKTIVHRLLYAVLFELGLLTVLAPYIAWRLGVGLWQAVIMGVSFSVFYLIYTFAFNWIYDVVFPVPDPQS